MFVNGNIQTCKLNSFTPSPRWEHFRHDVSHGNDCSRNETLGDNSYWKRLETQPSCTSDRKSNQTLSGTRRFAAIKWISCRFGTSRRRHGCKEDIKLLSSNAALVKLETIVFSTGSLTVSSFLEWIWGKRQPEVPNTAVQQNGHSRLAPKVICWNPNSTAFAVGAFWKCSNRRHQERKGDERWREERRKQ